MIIIVMMALVAGLATGIGAGIARYSAKQQSTAELGGLLAFAAGSVAALALVELVPHSYESLAETGQAAAAWVVAGCGLLGALAVALVDRIHHHHGDDNDPHMHGHSYLRSGRVTAGIVAVHNLLEGFLLFIIARESLTAGVILMLSIIVHNIALGTAIAAPLLAGGRSLQVTLRWTLGVGLCLTAGVLFGTWVSAELVHGATAALLIAAMAGALLWTAFSELLPMARLSQASRRLRTLLFVAGFAVVSGCIVFLGHDHAHVHLTGENDHAYHHRAVDLE